MKINDVLAFSFLLCKECLLQLNFFNGYNTEHTLGGFFLFVFFLTSTLLPQVHFKHYFNAQNRIREYKKVQ